MTARERHGMNIESGRRRCRRLLSGFLANHQVGSHAVCEGRGEAYNSISVGVGDPKISIRVKGGGIRIANRTDRCPAGALASNVEVRLTQYYAGRLPVSVELVKLGCPSSATTQQQGHSNAN
jgi:hypothetical protein